MDHPRTRLGPILTLLPDGLSQQSPRTAEFTRSLGRFDELLQLGDEFLRWGPECSGTQRPTAHVSGRTVTDVPVT